MEVYIHGKMLDLPQGDDINITFDNIRFGGSVLPDAISTDFEAPMTQNNRNLLGLTFEFWLGKAQRVACEAFVGNKHYAGYVVVNSATETTVSIAVFLSVSFPELSDLSLRRLINDNSSTIYRWAESRSLTQSGVFPRYTAEVQNTEGCYCRHAVADHNTITQAITTRTGIQFDENDFVGDFTLSEVAVVATGKYITPENKKQCIIAVCPSGDSVMNIFGGYHVVNDLELTEQPTYDTINNIWLPGEMRNSITFRRKCTATITTEVSYSIWQYQADLYVNGNPINAIDTSGAMNSITQKTIQYTFNVGDVLTFEGDVARDKYVMAKFEYSNYDIEEDDYDVELYYQPVSLKWSDWNATAPNADTDYPHSDWSFSYFGLWNNMPDKSIKSYLTTVCWMCNMRYVRTENPLSLKLTAFGAGDKILEREQVENIVFSSDKLARTNLIQYDEANPSQILYANGDGLENERVLFKSEFKAPVALRLNTAVVPIYTIEWSDDNTDQHLWKAEYEDLEGVVGYLNIDDLGYFSLGAPPRLTNMGLSSFGNVVEISGWTRQDISTEQSFVIDGIRFAIEKVDFSDNDGTYHYTAIRTGDAYMQVTPPQPVNERSFIGLYVNGEYRVIGQLDNTDFNLIGK